MRIEILGASGGIGGRLRTSSLRIDRDILIDCGTGAGNLSLEEMVAIERVFLTHCHLDHVALLPMLADSIWHFRCKPLLVHCLPDTASALKEYLFNGVLWPDYTAQPSPEDPYLAFCEIRIGEPVFCEQRKITPLAACHAVPAVGYLIEKDDTAFALSGDSTYCEAFWQALDRVDKLRYLMIEATFLEANRERAKAAGHMTPSLLKKGFERLGAETEILITHMEAGREEETMREILAFAGEFSPRRLMGGEVFSL